MWKRRADTVIQMEMAECGAAALAILLSYYKSYIPLEQLREDCGVSRSGVNAYNILEAAKKYGLEGEGYRVEYENLSSVETPAILFWQNNHFVVLEELRKNKAYINDPASGPRWVDANELKLKFSGVVLEIRPGPDFKPQGRRPSLFNGIRERLAPFRDVYGYLILLQMVLTLLALVVPVFSRVFLDTILAEQVFSWAWKFLAFLAGVMVLYGIVTWWVGSFLNLYQSRINIHFSTRYLWHLLHLPLSFFQQRSGGEVINRMGLNNRIASIFGGTLTRLSVQLLFSVFYAIIMVQYDLVLTLLGMGAGLLNIIVLLGVTRLRRTNYARLQQQQAKTVAASIDAIQHVETMKLVGNDNHFFQRIAGNYTKNINELQAIGVKDTWLFSISNLSQKMVPYLLIGLGSWRVMQGELTVGMLIGLQILMTTFLRPFETLVNLGSQVQTFQVDLNRLNDVLIHDEDPRIVQMRQNQEAPVRLAGSIEVKNLVFGYSRIEPPLLKNISINLDQGEWVALFGPVGSGKSTLAKMIAALETPWSGEILLGGESISEMSRKSLAQTIAFVAQDVSLFSGTIRENLTLWNPGLSGEVLDRATHDACVDNVIAARSGGYDAPVIEGGRNFSEGQRIRLDIARALAQDPTILILDESTRNLDRETEKEVLARIKKRGCTVLLITHRVPTLRLCDRIAVIDQGSIVQEGMYDDLAAKEGLFRRLVHAVDQRGET